MDKQIATGRLENPCGQAFREFQYPTPPLSAGREEIVEAVRAHHRRQTTAAQLPSAPAAGYQAESLHDLFGGSW